MDNVHLPLWGTQIMTPVVRKQNAKVVFRTQMTYPAATRGELRLETEIRTPDGRELA